MLGERIYKRCKIMAVTLVKYEAEVVEVHSGDDMVLMVNLGVDGLYKRVRARLHGVDTPDAFRSANTTKAGEVRDQVRKITRDKECTITVHTTGKGGWIVTLEAPDGENLVNINELLIEQGFVYQSRIA